MPEVRELLEVVRRLQAGEVGVFPCDTILGLVGGLGTTGRLYEIKQRPAFLPMVVLMPSVAMAQQFTEPWTLGQRQWADQLWPGAVSLVLAKNDRVPGAVTGGKETVALRVPRATLVGQLLSLWGQPLVSTSVNVSGAPFATRLQDISDEIRDRVDFIYSGEASLVGSPSPVIDLTEDPPRLLRSGRWM